MKIDPPLAIGLPALTLVGLAVGRDIGALKSLSWKIVVVALLTYSASFIAAAALGQLALGLQKIHERPDALRQLTGLHQRRG